MTPKQIKRLREKLKVSVQEFADLLDVNFSTVYRWERGEIVPPPSKVRLMRLVEKERGAA